jgi:rRNA maturation endonuclease Nob1
MTTKIEIGRRRGAIQSLSQYRMSCHACGKRWNRPSTGKTAWECPKCGANAQTKMVPNCSGSVKVADY